MSDLGFYADIKGIKCFLRRDKNIAWDLILGLTGNICDMCRAVSSRDDNIGRFQGYQMGDGFFLHFDRVKNEYGPCNGTPSTMVKLAIVLAQKFLIEHQGILSIGVAKGEVSGHSLGHLDRDNIGASKLFLLPITGTLLAETYRLTAVKPDKNSKQYKYEPKILINQNLYESLTTDMKDDLSNIKISKENIWQYNGFCNPDKTIKKLYKRIWNEDITAKNIKKALGKYNENNP